MEEEFRFHVEMETEQNLRRGMSPQEARRQALLAFGGVERVKEKVRDARGTRPLEDTARDLRFALRRLAREPGYSVPTMATMAFGIGVTVAVFTLVNGVLLRPLPYPDAERLVEVRHEAPGAELAVTGLSIGTFLHYREGNRVFEEIGVYMEDARPLTDGDAPEQVRTALVSPDLLQVLGARPHLRRLPRAADFEPDGWSGLFISYDLWVRRYGADPSIVGRTIELDRRSGTVVGVAQPGFHFPHPETRVWIVWPQEERQARYGGPRASVRGLYMNGVARLRPGVSTDEAERDLDRLIRTLPDVYPDVTADQLDRMGLRGVVVPLKETVVGDVRVALLLLLTTAGFLLLITLANATNLSLVRAERLRGEVALERALGASDGRVARRFLSEGALLAAVGGSLGLALAWVAVELRFGFDPEGIPRLGEVVMDGAAVGLGVVLALLTAALLAMVALSSTRRPNPAAALTGTLGRVTAGPKEQLGRRFLVVAQVALALALLIGAALMAQSFWQLKQVELGFRPEGGVTFFLPVPSSAYPDHQASARLHAQVLERLRALPGVEAAGAATVAAFPLAPVPDYYVDRVSVANRPAGDSADAPHALFSYATADYFRAMGIPLLKGRTFQTADASPGAPGVILSAALARSLFGGGDPIGRRVRLRTLGDLPLHVVGVAGDVPSRTIADGPSRAVYLPHIQRAQDDTTPVRFGSPRDEMYVVRTSLPPLSLVPAIRRTIDGVDPKLAMARIGTLEDLVDRSMTRPRVTMLLLLVGAGTALFLGLVGIYGVLAYAVRQRGSELGIRIALGASPVGVVRMVVREGAVLASIGIAAGLVAAFALTRLLGSLLYQVSPSDPATFAGMAALLFAVAIVASYVPARRAGRIDPVQALRTE